MALNIQISDRVLSLNGRSGPNHRDTSFSSLTLGLSKSSSKDLWPLEQSSGKINSDPGLDDQDPYENCTGSWIGRVSTFFPQLVLWSEIILKSSRWNAFRRMVSIFKLSWTRANWDIGPRILLCKWAKVNILIFFLPKKQILITGQSVPG